MILLAHRIQSRLQHAKSLGCPLICLNGIIFLLPDVSTAISVRLRNIYIEDGRPVIQTPLKPHQCEESDMRWRTTDFLKPFPVTLIIWWWFPFPLTHNILFIHNLTLSLPKRKHVRWEINNTMKEHGSHRLVDWKIRNTKPFFFFFPKTISYIVFHCLLRCCIRFWTVMSLRIRTCCVRYADTQSLPSNKVQS